VTLPPAIDIGLLGPVTIRVDGREVHPGGRRPRAVIAVLASGNRPISADALVDAVWSDTDGGGSKATLQVHIHNVRAALAPHAAALTSSIAGYALSGTDTDIARVTTLSDRAQSAYRAGDLPTARGLWRRALSEFRGDYGQDLIELRALDAGRAHWREREADIRDALMDAELHLGTAGLVPELESGVEQSPLRERRWGQLMIALYRDGRQADALQVYRRARAVLASELGLDPSSGLRALEAAVLNQVGTQTLLRIGGPVPTGTRSDAPVLLWLDRLGTQRRRSLLEPGLVSIGRDAHADIELIGDESASRRHAQILIGDGRAEVSDCGSTNGTWLNGQRIPPDQPFPLRPGDLLRVGQTAVFVSVSHSAGHDLPGPAADQTVHVPRPPSSLA
jgi:DNA-binding SARP family transcriptional activator